MNVKIVFDSYENEYIAFIPGTKFQGYGLTEKEAVIDFLNQCVDNPIFNQSVIRTLLLNI